MGYFSLSELKETIGLQLGLESTSKYFINSIWMRKLKAGYTGSCEDCERLQAVSAITKFLMQLDGSGEYWEEKKDFTGKMDRSVTG